MTNENIVKRLRDASERMLDMNLPLSAHLMQEAADEIEYLRQRCEQIDQERQERSEFIRNRVADKSTMLKGGYHARRICLEAAKYLQDKEGEQ